MLGYLRETLDVAIPRWVEVELARRPVSMLERLEYRIRSGEHRLLGELPTYVFNCLRGEPHPIRAFPGYLRDAWGLASLAEVPPHALALAGRRLRAAMFTSAIARAPRRSRSGRAEEARLSLLGPSPSGGGEESSEQSLALQLRPPAAARRRGARRRPP